MPAEDSPSNGDRASEFSPPREAIEYLRTALEDGRDWPTAMMEAIALWTVPEETHQGRDHKYLIEGEAFDWLLLAERLCHTVDGLIPQSEKEELLFSGRFPEPFDENRFKGLLGVDKYRAYLNFYYGVIAEQALQLAVEQEVFKRLLSNGNQYQDDFSDDAFARIYGEAKGTLLKQFRQEKGYPSKRSITITESKEFTYWLFRHRVKRWDGARVASDTRKGLEYLHKMRAP